MQKRELVCGDEIGCGSWLFGGQWVDMLSYCLLFSPLRAPGRKSSVAHIKGHRLKNLRGLDFGSAIYQLRDLENIQFSRSVMSDFLRPHEVQHARPPCPSPTPGVHSDSCPSSQ